MTSQNRATQVLRRSKKLPTSLPGWSLTIILLVGCCYFAVADEDGFRQKPMRQAGSAPQVDRQDNADSFTFVRIRYDSTGGYGESWYEYEGRAWERWETDFPRAELNFLYRLDELTSFKVNPEPIVLRLTDERLFDYPFIFMSDVGWQYLTPSECERLKEYFDRGGFLWVDDFWGQAEWDNFERNMDSVAPHWQWHDLPADHPILSTVYPLEGCPQVPARIFYVGSGLSYDPPQLHRYPNGGTADLKRVHFRGLFDDAGRMVAIATHNTDIADGWEREGEAVDFFTRFSIDAYALGINILFYAMAH